MNREILMKNFLKGVGQAAGGLVVGGLITGLFFILTTKSQNNVNIEKDKNDYDDVNMEEIDNVNEIKDEISIINTKIFKKLFD